MRVTFDRDELSRTLRAVKPFKAGRAAIPVLTAVQITRAGDGHVWLETTDLEAGVEQAVAARIDGDFARLVVPFKELEDALKSVGKRPHDVSIEIGDARTATLTADGASVMLNPIDPGDFPTWPTEKPELLVDVPDLFDAVRRVSVAASKDVQRPILCGVCVQPSEAKGEIDVVTTDSYRLAVQTIQGDLPWADDKDRDRIYPAKPLLAMAKRDPVAFSVSQSYGFVAGHGWGGAVRRIEGTFPNWRSLFGKGNTRLTWTVDPSDLPTLPVEATKKLPVRLDFAEHVIRVTGADTKVEASLPGDVHGTFEGDEAAFNLTYLVDGLKAAASATSTGRVQVSIIDGLKPALIDPVYPPASQAGADAPIAAAFRYLVMPVRV